MSFSRKSQEINKLLYLLSFKIQNIFKILTVKENSRTRLANIHWALRIWIFSGSSGRCFHIAHSYFRYSASSEGWATSKSPPVSYHLVPSHWHFGFLSKKILALVIAALFSECAVIQSLLIPKRTTAFYQLVCPTC